MEELNDKPPLITVAKYGISMLLFVFLYSTVIFPLKSLFLKAARPRNGRPT